MSIEKATTKGPQNEKNTTNKGGLKYRTNKAKITPKSKQDKD